MYRQAFNQLLEACSIAEEAGAQDGLEIGLRVRALMWSHQQEMTPGSFVDTFVTPVLLRFAGAWGVGGRVGECARARETERVGLVAPGIVRSFPGSGGPLTTTARPSGVGRPTRVRGGGAYGLYEVDNL